MSALRFWSLRAKFLLLLLTGAVVPLVIVSFWLTGSTLRSGKALLNERLDSALDLVVSEAGMHWVDLRSEMLDVAEDSLVQRLVQAPPGGKTGARAPAEALARTRTLHSSLASPLLLASESGNTWTVGNEGMSGTESSRGIAISVPVRSRANSATAGALRSTLTLESLVPEGAGGAAAIGAILHLSDRTTGASLSALPFDASLMARDEFELAGERWLVRRRNLEEPAITIAAASPLGTYTVPFRDAARKGTIAILAVALGVIAISALFTRRLTQSLENLATATHAVAAGDLDRRVAEDGADEVGRVGRAFNAMTESLRITLRKLSQREALVAVGEFAAALAHEVRNPLTSIRIDLQRVEEKLPGDSPLRVQLGRALREVQRLDHTVSGALRVARSGSIASDIVDLRVPLERAIEVSLPAFEQRGAALQQIEIAGSALPVRGDEAALEQLFLNILLNAAQAVDVGERAGVTATEENGEARVSIWDSGPGISPENASKVFDPFFSTKTEGTGLGLSVARQIAIAHGGAIRIDSAPDSGATISITIPIADLRRPT